VKSCVIYLTESKNKNSPDSQTVSTGRIAPKICQGQPQQINNVLRVLQISAKSVHLRRSYSRRRGCTDSSDPGHFGPKTLRTQCRGVRKTLRLGPKCPNVPAPSYWVRSVCTRTRKHRQIESNMRRKPIASSRVTSRDPRPAEFQILI